MEETKPLILSLRTPNSRHPSAKINQTVYSPVVAIMDRVRKRVHTRRASQDSMSEEHSPRTTSSSWRQKFSNRSQSISSLASFFTARSGTPPSLGNTPTSKTATRELPITPPESESKLSQTAPSIIVTPPEVSPSEATSVSHETTLSLSSSNLNTFPLPPTLPPTQCQTSPPSPPRNPMTSTEKQAWKDFTDDIVKSYMRANDMFLDRLESLKEKAEGNQVYLNNIDVMMEKALNRRQRIAVEGERVHSKIERRSDRERREEMAGEVREMTERPGAWKF